VAEGDGGGDLHLVNVIAQEGNERHNCSAITKAA
jgi:hypothetical protein